MMEFTNLADLLPKIYPEKKIIGNKSALQIRIDF